MSDTPDRIWASTGLYYTYVTDWTEGEWGVSDCDGFEYRRADLPPTREQIMADPRVMALVEALKGALDELQECSLIICGEDYNSPSHNAALAALTDNEGETE